MKTLFTLFALSALCFSSCKQTPTDEISMSDEMLLDTVQYKTFQYFWEGAEPTSGMARERFHADGDYTLNDREVVTSGGSGFGIMAIIAAIDRGFITRAEGVERMNKIVSFIEKADSFHGLFPHWWHGATGKAKGFSEKDNGGDIVESAFLFQGLLAAHQYFVNGSDEEKEIASRIDKLWRAAEWSWHQNGQDVLFWHWSPNHDWGMSHAISGFDECLIAYVLGASSPTYSISADAYHKGWARNGAISEPHELEGHKLMLHYNNSHGAGPLFWSHYSFLGLDPRGLKDRYCENYFEEMKNYTLVNRSYCIRNPKEYKEYGENAWGLTASYSVGGYAAHHPHESGDHGVIAPTAALSSIVYTPEESMDVMRYLYNRKDTLMGDYGFYDAFSDTKEWYPQRYLAIDQGTTAVMIENHRTQLLWNLFMSHPDVQKGLAKLGFEY